MQNQASPAAPYEEISYTALGVAFARTFSDIPFAREIAEVSGANKLTPDSRQLHTRLAPYFVARFSAISRLVEQSGIKNVIELAAGLSPRGLIMSADADIRYFETDLPNMLRLKRKILGLMATTKHLVVPKNLRFHSLDVSDERELDSIARSLAGPVAIINEGLLPYFSFAEKRSLAMTIHGVLQRNGGRWITSDIITRQDMQKTAPTEAEKRLVRDALAASGRDYESYAFDDLASAKKFFDKLGFAYEIHSLGEVVGFPPVGAYDRQLLTLNVWELMPK